MCSLTEHYGDWMYVVVHWTHTNTPRGTYFKAPPAIFTLPRNTGKGVHTGKQRLHTSTESPRRALSAPVSGTNCRNKSQGIET